MCTCVWLCVCVCVCVCVFMCVCVCMYNTHMLLVYTYMCPCVYYVRKYMYIHTHIYILSMRMSDTRPANPMYGTLRDNLLLINKRKIAKTVLLRVCVCVNRWSWSAHKCMYTCVWKFVSNTVQTSHVYAYKAYWHTYMPCWDKKILCLCARVGADTHVYMDKTITWILTKKGEMQVMSHIYMSTSTFVCKIHGSWSLVVTKKAIIMRSKNQENRELPEYTSTHSSIMGIFMPWMYTSVCMRECSRNLRYKYPYMYVLAAYIQPKERNKKICEM